MALRVPSYYRDHFKAALVLPFVMAFSLFEMFVMLFFWPIIFLTDSRSLRSVLNEMSEVFWFIVRFDRQISALVSDGGPPRLISLRFGQAPTVLNVPKDEQRDFVLMRATAMLRRHVWGWFVAFWYAFRHPDLKFITDDDFTRTIESGPWATYLVEVEDLSDWNEENDGKSRYWSFEMPLMQSIKYFEEFHGAGTRTLFREIPAGEVDSNPHLQALAIIMMPSHTTTQYITRPQDDAWNPAKLYVTHGATHYLVLSRHPMLHFPMDTVNAQTHYLPLEHPIRLLLEPHQRFTLPLNNLVLNSGFLSILVNRWLDIAPFDCPVQSIDAFVRDGYKDYSFEKVIPDSPFGYGQFVRGYYHLFYDFVHDIIQNDKSGRFVNEDVRTWGNEIAKVLKDFPTGDELIKDRALLAKTLAVVMTDVSVMHGADHSWYFHKTPWDSVPWRIRNKAPTSASGDRWIRTNANTRFDKWKFYLTQVCIFFTGPNSSLGDVHYDGWEDEQRRFRKALKDYDASLSEYVKVSSLKNIAPSIDF